MKTRLVALTLLLSLALTGAAQAAPNDPGVTVPIQRSDLLDAISPAPFTRFTAGNPQSGAMPKPHPILADVRVRRAIAFCTDKAGLLASVYPDLTPAQRQALVADTFIRPTSWAYTAPATVYPYGPEQGRTLLDQAGWILEPGATYRTRSGKELVLTLRTTTAAFRVTFLTVFEAQMQACGIHIIREHLSSDWFFGDMTGLSVRDFELSDFAWVLDDNDPRGRTLWACDKIPMPANGWQGQNYPGWCNHTASAAIAMATDTALSQEQRKAAYAVVIDAVAADVPQLPLFWRLDPATGQPSEVLEHIELNLETFSQDTELAPAAQATLVTADYVGNAGSIIVPTGAVTQSATLSYYPLVASAHTLPDNSTEVAPSRLTAALQGVPQAAFAFNTPVLLTVGYDDASLSSIWDEAALNLYRWVEGTGWQPAQESCPEGQRYYHVDRATNTVVVHICHLSEFALIGGTKHVAYLPLVRSFDPLLYDDFNNPALSGAYNSTLWSFSGEAAGYQGSQQAGAFVFTNDPAVTPAWSCASLMLTKPQQRSLAQLQQFEARLKLASDLSGGKASVEMSYQSWKVGVPARLWSALCWIGANIGSQPSLECNIGGSSGLAYSTGYHDVAYDTWHTVRIEANPVSAELRYYLDGALIGSHTPSDAADVLQADSFVPRISACTYSTGTSATRYVDDVRITPAQ